MGTLATLLIGFSLGTVVMFLAMMVLNKESCKIQQLEAELEYMRECFKNANRYQVCKKCMTRKEIDQALGIE